MLPEGHGLPGGDAADVAGRMEEQTAYLSPSVVARVRWIVRLWDVTPLPTQRAASRAWIATSSKGGWRLASARVVPLGGCT